MFPLPSMMCATAGYGVIGMSNAPIQNGNFISTPFGQNISLPPNAAVGDLCIQIVGSVNQDGGPGVFVPTSPAGWTLLLYGSTVNGAVSYETYWAGYKILDSTDVASGYVLGATAPRSASGAPGKYSYYGQSIAVIRGVGAPTGAAGTSGAFSGVALACGSVTKSASAKYILAIAVGAPNDSPAFTLTSESAGFKDVCGGQVCNGGMMMIADARNYTSGTTAQMTTYSPFAFVGETASYELPSL